MSDYELMIKITGSPQAIEAIDDWLSNDPAYQALITTIADITDQAIAESGVLGKKKVTVTVGLPPPRRSVRQFGYRRAQHDYSFVWAQVKQYKPPVLFPEKYTAKAYDKATRALIEWAKEQGIEIELPDFWQP